MVLKHLFYNTAKKCLFIYTRQYSHCNVRVFLLALKDSEIIKKVAH
jgi:hypothetical protein